MLELKVKKLDERAQLPTKNNISDAGFDLYACCWSDKEIYTGKTVKINTGIALEIPAGYYGQIFDRSSMGAKGIHVHGGVIDSSYRGEIAVCLQNTNIDTEEFTIHSTNGDNEHSYEKYRAIDPDRYTIKHGDKIAQIVLLPVPAVQVVEVTELSDSDRGDKGFGSSGR